MHLFVIFHFGGSKIPEEIKKGIKRITTFIFILALTACGSDSSSSSSNEGNTSTDDVSPTITSTATATTIDENSGAGQIIYTVTSDDDTATYNLSGTDSASFTINETSGEVTLISDPDFESQSTYSFIVTAINTENNSSTLTITLAINDIEEADLTPPAITSSSTAAAIDENSGATQVIYTATSDDNSATYSLSGIDSSSFIISASSGEVILISDPDFESQSTYRFIVTATDTENNSATLTISLAINDIEEADLTPPAITSSATAAAIDENSGAGQIIYTVTSDDSTATYSLSGTDSASFTIDASSGEVTLIGDPDFESQSTYRFLVTATDTANNSATLTITLAINDIVEGPAPSTAPTITSAATATTIDENSGAGQIIYTVTSDDSTATYSLSGTDSASFTINEASGEVTLISDPDFESQSTYSFIVTATDTANNSSTLTITLAINDIEEADLTPPAITSSGTAAAIDENSGAAQVIYTTTSDDSTATYSLSGTDSASFTINETSGEVTLISDPDFETQSAYSFIVTVTDTANNSATLTITLAINDIEEADLTPPAITSSDTAAAVDENSGAGQIIYTVTSDDSTATYSLSGTDSASFTISETSGEVTLTNNPDFESQSTYSFIVTATDTANNSATLTITLAINDIEEADLTPPAITSSDTATAIDENSGAGQIIYTVTSDDSTATYSLSGTDSASFTINASSGEVTLISDPDFEIQSAYSFIVTATDTANNESSITVSLAINNIALSTFDITNTQASTTAIKTITFSWDSAAENVGENIVYTLCEEDMTAVNNCNPLSTVTDALTLNASLSSLVNALSSNYFILASSGSEFEASSQVSIGANEITNMIGYFKASNTGEEDYFGYSIALSGDGSTLAIGANEEDNNVSGIVTDGSETSDSTKANISGAVYLFNNDSGKWVQTAYVKASNTGANDRFGSTVALNNDGSVLAVSATGEDNDATGIDVTGSEVSGNNDVINSGAVYIFTNESSSWQQTTYIKASKIKRDDDFGNSIALSGDGYTLAVGVADEDSDLVGVVTDGSETTSTGAENNSGAVYLYTYATSTDSWSQAAYIKASNTGASDKFGNSVALDADGSTLAVGAYLEDNSEAGISSNGIETSETSETEDSGAVYLFSNDSGSWLQTAYVKASNPDPDDEFGYSVALSGDGNTLAVSAIKEDNTVTGILTDNSESTETSSLVDSGAVYLFKKVSTWSQAAYIKPTNSDTGDFFGASLALNHDGNTLAVGAYLEDNSEAGIFNDNSETLEMSSLDNSGAVYLFKNTSTWSQVAYIKASNTDINDMFGEHVALSNDGNTLAISALGDDNSAIGIIKDGSENMNNGGDTGTETDSGAVYIY